VRGSAIDVPYALRSRNRPAPSCTGEKNILDICGVEKRVCMSCMSACVCVCVDTWVSNICVCVRVCM
jgi:hypothetical protein